MDEGINTFVDSSNENRGEDDDDGEEGEGSMSSGVPAALAYSFLISNAVWISIIPELFPKKRYSFSRVRRFMLSANVRVARSSASSSGSPAPPAPPAPSGAGEESEEGVPAFSFEMARMERVAMFIALYGLFFSASSASGSNKAHMFSGLDGLGNARVSKAVDEERSILGTSCLMSFSIFSSLFSRDSTYPLGGPRF